MNGILLFLKCYFLFFFGLASLYYFIPAGLWYYLFFIRKKDKWKYMRIQAKFPTGKQIKREIKYSMLSIVIFSLISVGLYYLVTGGYTKMYYRASDHGMVYFILSPLIFIVVHDALFYWSHRFMHIKRVFKYFHLIHHKSTNPTPFSIYAFQPGEAVIEYSIYPILLFLLPVHPVMLGFFMVYNIAVNIAGHGGFEFMPERFRKHKIFRWQNSVTNHDLHHTNFKCNYGFYFTFWDKIMNTAASDGVKKEKGGNKETGIAKYGL